MKALMIAKALKHVTRLIPNRNCAVHNAMRPIAIRSVRGIRADYRMAAAGNFASAVAQVDNHFCADRYSAAGCSADHACPCSRNYFSAADYFYAVPHYYHHYPATDCIEEMPYCFVEISNYHCHYSFWFQKNYSSVCH